MSWPSRQAKSPGAFWTLLTLAVVLAIVRLVVKAGALYLAGLPLRLAGWAVLWLLAVVVFVPGLLLTERAVSRYGHRTWFYLSLLVVGSLLVSNGTVVACDALDIPERFFLSPPVPRWVGPFLDVWIRAGVALFVYGGHRQTLEAAAAVQALEARRAQMVRRLAESRLQTARARVRPETFIEELRALDRKYGESPAQAEIALEGLIVRLRAASRGVPP